MAELLAQIKAKSSALGFMLQDDLQLDSDLGEIEALIYKARQMISDDWAMRRAASRIRISHRPSHPRPTIDDLLA